MFIPLGDTHLFATAFGSKTSPVIVTLGGWIGSWEDWLETVSLLSEQWRVIAYDHRGSGVTISPVETITFERQVEDVLAVLDAFAVETCVLAAMSMGCAVALGAALRQPERISALVLVDSLDLRDIPPPPDDRFLLGLQQDYSRTLDAFIQACVPEPNSETIKHWGRHILNRATQESAITLYQLSKQVPIRDQLSQISQPTLLIHGDQDHVSPLQASEWLSGILAHCTLKVIQGAGHVPILTFPEQVASSIQAFFVHTNTSDFSTESK
jgi:3-oxoadipate enol-lactonase